ncbi:unnamed protein product [Trichogramma brassicae]|uniref:Uncharacterized protein n=1 Tax=Trichogramma brassicae TaxID=86971 RepID=A0A6H5IZR3_9HYME|nr:unnamed protein product [Trichogramma brassicae]
MEAILIFKIISQHIAISECCDCASRREIDVCDKTAPRESSFAARSVLYTTSHERRVFPSSTWSSRREQYSDECEIATTPHT